MFNKNKKMLLEQIYILNDKLMRSNIIEIISLMGNKKELLYRNLLAGIARGIGIGIGVTIITALLIMLLQKIVTLNIPVLGKYISDIIEIVQKSR